MPDLLAPCGLCCSDCPTFQATQADDHEARKRTAAMMLEKFGVELAPEQINCDGCVSTGDRRIGYCAVCAVRQCAVARGVASCAVCADYACETLSAFLARAPQAKARLEALREERSASK